MRNRIPLLAVAAVFALVVAACSSSSDETTTTTAPSTTTTTEAAETSVLDLAIEAGQFSTLIAAIDAAGLADTLEGEGPFTVLAPTDAAFAEAFEALGIEASDLLADTDTLTAILTYHVIGQSADSELVATLDGQSVETLNGQSVDVSVVDGQIMVNEATVVSADLMADNGIVHVINGVLLPPDIAATLGAAAPEQPAEPMEPTIAETVVELASANPAEFTILLAALEAADLVDALDNPNDELTVFAPTDEAFGAALEALGLTAEELLASDNLAAILTYHVTAEGVLDAATVVAAAPVAALSTLNPDATLSVDVIDGSVVINDGADPLGGATVVKADVFASNGVIHVIDTVLVP
ncbi:MAG: fasciclin domain-containing protein [Armatimonadetes bacterium]|nr:MAG: fasciclin domain-containing protein [Armatimonadota bacterium]